MKPRLFNAVMASCALSAMLMAAAAAQANANERYRVFYRGKWVQYFEQNGLAIAEGDIVLGTASDIARIRDGKGLAKALVVDDPSLLWPLGSSGAHEVPYIFESGPQSNVDAAVAQFNAAFTGIIQWVPRTTQGDYVTFNLVGPTGSCFSEVGRAGGKQQIGGSTTCSLGALLHEMGHAIGFWHTQSDVAQASFLRVFYETMDPRWRDQYRPIVDARALDGYDYGSIMHYGPFVESTTPDPLTASTVPPGIDTGLRTGYSAADIDSVKRLYGGTPNTVTVTSNPSGLQVLIDGDLRVTPATFNWRIGSLHRLDVPASVQDSGAFKFAFGRWNHDPSPIPKSAQEWIVDPGQGFPSQPATAPRNTVLVANFVRLVQVQPFLSGGAFGQFNATPEIAAWPGTTDYYPQFTKFTLAAQPKEGFLHTWLTSSFLTLTGGSGGVPEAIRRIGTATPMLMGATFFAAPAIVVQTAGAGVDGSLRANITPPGGAQSSPTLIPNVLRSTAIGSYTIAADAPQNRSDSVRFSLQSIDGLDDRLSGMIALPLGGEPTKVVTLNFQKQFQPFIERHPTCGGFVALSKTSQWLALGTSVSATASLASGVVMGGWAGTVSGTNPTTSMTVDRVPEFVAHFNTIPEPLAVTSVTPLTYTPGQGPVTFQFTGTGFTVNSFVTMDDGSQRRGVVVPDSSTLRVTLGDADFPRSGRVGLTVSSTISAGCVAFADAVAIDVQPKVTPQMATVYEFYNQVLDRYFRTASDAEAAAIRANPATGERDTGQTFKAWTSTAYPAGASTVYRFYGSVAPGPNSHFFTADFNEARLLQRAELDTPAATKRWNYEELSFAIKPAQNGGCSADAPVRIYRAYNNGFARGVDSNHRYLVDFNLYTQMIALGWLGEGVVMCGPQ